MCLRLCSGGCFSQEPSSAGSNHRERGGVYLPPAFVFFFSTNVWDALYEENQKKKWHTLLREMWKAPSSVVIVVWVAFYTSKMLHHESNRSMYSCELLL